LTDLLNSLIVELIHSLAFEERVNLVNVLVKSPDLVNLMLKAIADQMNQGKS
jgi:hypothetical protein